MKRQTTMTVAWTWPIVVAVSTIACGNAGTRWQQPVPRQCPSLYQWTDTCNVYALTDGEVAILIDLGIDRLAIDRRLRDGEVVEWEGYRLQLDGMPGQTEFGCCLWLELDDLRVALPDIMDYLK